MNTQAISGSAAGAATLSATAEFDFVIVGAGSAGCVLADRLSADGRSSVLLIEAGPPDRSPWIHFPLGLQFALRDARLDWRLISKPEPGLAGRRIGHPRGKTLGGSSAMNGMIYLRGQAEDYDAWAAAGCAGWAWRDVLPYFLRSEGNLDLPPGPLHSRSGPLQVSTPARGDALCEALLAAGQGAGVALSDDFNGAQQEGVGYYQHTLAAGRRQSTATAFLNRAKGRRNLTVWSHTQVLRIDIEAQRATGVTLLRGGARPQHIRARREVLLCAGAFHSPQLLQCSGIGDAPALQALGIAPQLHRPEVGRNLQDHIQAKLRYVLRQPLGLNPLFHSRWQQAVQAFKYLFGRRGRMAAPPIRTGLFCRSEPALARPDLQFHFIEFSSAGMGQDPHPFPGYQSTVCVLQPHSRGTVHTRGALADHAPAIQGLHLSAPEDMRRTLAGVRWARRLALQPALAALIDHEAEPGSGMVDEAELEAWVRQTAVTVYHPVGSCRMGEDDAAVVDSALRVRGVQHLRVVDASVMPTLVSGNTNAAVIMIAEKAADLTLSASH